MGIFKYGKYPQDYKPHKPQTGAFPPILLPGLVSLYSLEGGLLIPLGSVQAESKNLNIRQPSPSGLGGRGTPTQAQEARYLRAPLG